MRRSIFLLTVLLAGCATPSARIADGLTRYGLDQTRANCIGDRLQTHLSLGQLRQLGRAAKAYAGSNPTTPLNPSDLLRAASQINDPAILVEVGTAGLACGVGPALLH